MIEPQIIDFPKICDPRGNLSFIESEGHVPFEVKRCYWIYDVPGGMFRNGHAFREQDELIVALSGSFDVVLNDGTGEKRYHMSRSYYGLYVPHMTWRAIDNFSTNSVALVLSSTSYEPSDGKLIPFDIKRVFYIYDVPGGEERGGHSHKKLQQVIVAISGAFDVLLDDGVNQRSVTLNRPYQGLLVAPGVWSKQHNFSSGSVCLVLASDHYCEEDYVRDYDQFLQLTSNKK